MEKLKEYAELAHNILNKNGTSAETNYLQSKNIISSFFDKKKNGDLKTVISRLTLIDSYYSTQINSKRLFGIDDLAKKIFEISNGSDEILRNKCTKFLETPETLKDIKDLFEFKKYGIHKNGESAGQAPSLISKYLYFLTEYNFPIYDTLAISSYEKIRLKFKDELEIPVLMKEFHISYFACLTQLDFCTGIKKIDKLDNLLWLLGKFTEGSFSIVLDKETYIKLTQLAIYGKNIKETTVDDLIRIYLKNNDNLQEIFKDNDLIKFIQFSLQFVKIKNN
ncbi:MAG: hypothetical protein A2046_10190 [Bacteroidetes bacterium GWA2_30_7]|nr:MAG: hypothetical protein A2046_10190 [Bacteroidetes bacterium GWA2_30_7]